jgi:Na+-translocating ferredoxin:NAD+ oxidoreductase RnfE subunit
VSFQSSQKFDSTCRGVHMVARAVLLLYAGCFFESHGSFFPAAVVSRSNIPACKPSRLTLRNGTVDGSQDGAAHGLGASCAGVVDGEARDYIVGELGFAEDGDTVVRSFADAVETSQFCVYDIADLQLTHVGSLKVSLSSMVKSIPFSKSSTGSYSCMCQATEVLPQDL